MTVKQLIKKLERLEQDLNVYILIKGDSDEYTINGVEEGELENAQGTLTWDVAYILCE